jgi:hypothetical protein
MTPLSNTQLSIISVANTFVDLHGDHGEVRLPTQADTPQVALSYLEAFIEVDYIVIKIRDNEVVVQALVNERFRQTYSFTGYPADMAELCSLASRSITNGLT